MSKYFEWLFFCFGFLWGMGDLCRPWGLHSLVLAYAAETLMQIPRAHAACIQGGRGSSTDKRLWRLTLLSLSIAPWNKLKLSIQLLALM
jgi:hypothetical protein